MQMISIAQFLYEFMFGSCNLPDVKREKDALSSTCTYVHDTSPCDLIDFSVLISVVIAVYRQHCSLVPSDLHTEQHTDNMSGMKGERRLILQF